MNSCTYTLIKSDGYEDVWKSECGYRVACQAPEEVGMNFAPKPNEDGKFCHHCGKEIKLKERK